MSSNKSAFTLPLSVILTISFIILLVLVIAFISIFVYRVSTTVFINNYSKELLNSYRAFSTVPQRGIMGSPGFMGGWRNQQLYENMFVQIGENVIRDNDEIGNQKFVEGPRIVSESGKTYLLYGFVENGEKLIIGTHMLEYEVFLNALKKTLGLGVLLAIALSLIFGIIMGRRIAKPLKEISNALQDTILSDLSKRIEMNSKAKEIHDLKEALNRSLEKIEEAYRRQEQFSSDVAHEIRSPLTSIVGFSRLIKRWGIKDPDVVLEAAKNITETAESMITLTESLLFLAKPDLKPEFSAVNLKEALEKALDFVSRSANIEMKFELPGIIVMTDKKLIQLAFKILLENSIKHAPGKPIEIFWKSESSTLIFRDYGPGIPEQEKKRVFQRFYKGDFSRTGSGYGLGLSIFKKIIDTLGLTVQVETPETGGTMFLLGGWNEIRSVRS
ncbi:MAG: HAMP domain-containing histidine kinase [Kosmotoga sp.]|uniref:HAMP domain-containing sensor histidine kinase n=1 Tax=Kosmotoga sp. TaxID=1955248 RepID=UPI0025BC4F80|nr:HAMP domain-containing sensor histidine kinase [Kosmotoga sp.]MCD6159166.1 HAMP domain-containing histidine kinase [Kosmotoga sp.]